MQRTGNPALGKKTFEIARSGSGDVMTISGTVNKTFALILLLLASAVWSWNEAMVVGPWGSEPVIPGWYLPMLIGGLVIGFVIIFKKTTAPVLAPVYAVCEGMLIGTISALYETRFQGIVLQAGLLTIGVLLALLIAYRSGMIKVTENFKLGVVAATGGIAIVYLIDLGMRFFGMQMPLLHENSPMGIAISLGIVVIASLNLVLDFDFIEQGAARGAPKYMEWYAGFGLLVTLIWLYLEILRLLSKTKSRN